MRILAVFFLCLLAKSIVAVSVDNGDVNNSVLIKFENEETIDSLKAARPDLMFERVFPYSEKHDARHRDSGLHLWYKIFVNDRSDAGILIDELKSNKGVRLIERPKKIEIPEIENEVSVVDERNIIKTNSVGNVNDPLYPMQWHYQNAAGVSINLEPAWDIEVGSRDVVVAVMDTRVDVEHPDLHDNMWVNKAEFDG